MKCQTIRKRLEREFDEGGPRAAGVEDHLETCRACQRYAAQLAELDGALGRLPAPMPSPGLAMRVQRRIASQRMYTRAALIAAAAALLAVSGWFYPLPIRPAAWWSAASMPVLEYDWYGLLEWRPGLAWQDVARTLSAPVLALWRVVGARVPAGFGPSPLVVWGALSALALSFVGLNGWQAAHGIPVVKNRHVNRGGH